MPLTSEERSRMELLRIRAQIHPCLKLIDQVGVHVDEVLQADDLEVQRAHRSVAISLVNAVLRLLENG